MTPNPQSVCKHCHEPITFKRGYFLGAGDTRYCAEHDGRHEPTISASLNAPAGTDQAKALFGKLGETAPAEHQGVQPVNSFPSGEEFQYDDSGFKRLVSQAVPHEAEVTPKLEEIAREIAGINFLSFDERVKSIAAILRPFITPASTPQKRTYTDQDWKEAAVLYGNALKEIEVWKNRALKAEATPATPTESVREGQDVIAKKIYSVPPAGSTIQCSACGARSLYGTTPLFCAWCGVKFTQWDDSEAVERQFPVNARMAVKNPASPSVPLLDVDGLAKNIAKLFICNQEKSAKRIAQEIRAALVKKETP